MPQENFPLLRYGLLFWHKEMTVAVCRNAYPFTTGVLKYITPKTIVRNSYEWQWFLSIMIGMFLVQEKKSYDDPIAEDAKGMK